MSEVMKALMFEYLKQFDPKLDEVLEIQPTESPNYLVKCSIEYSGEILINKSCLVNVKQFQEFRDKREAVTWL